jgi:hypothetical protein
MTNLRKLTVLAGLMGLCSSSNLRAEMASGSFTNTFNNDVRIWDISGSYNEGVEGFALNYTINMDQSGKFTGHGSTTVEGFANMDLAFWGSVHNVSSNVTRVNLSLRLKGSIDMGSQGSMYVRATLNEKLEIDAAAGSMVGTMGGSASVSIPSLHRSVTQRIPVSDVDTSLPVGMTGNWDLTLNVQTNGTHYTGTGDVTLSNGRTVPLVATGTYGVKTDISRLTLKSVGTNGIVHLGLTSTVQGGQLQIQRLLGRALGQTLRSQQLP